MQLQPNNCDTLKKKLNHGGARARNSDGFVCLH